MQIDKVVQDLNQLGSFGHEVLKVKNCEGKLIPYTEGRPCFFVRLLNTLISPLTALFFQVFPKYDPTLRTLNFLEAHQEEISRTSALEILNKLLPFCKLRYQQKKRTELFEVFDNRPAKTASTLATPSCEKKGFIAIDLTNKRGNAREMMEATHVRLTSSTLKRYLDTAKDWSAAEMKNGTRWSLPLDQLTLVLKEGHDCVGESFFEQIDGLKEQGDGAFQFICEPETHHNSVQISCRGIDRMPQTHGITHVKVTGSNKLDATSLMGNFPDLELLDLSDFRGDYSSLDHLLVCLKQTPVVLVKDVNSFPNIHEGCFRAALERHPIEKCYNEELRIDNLEEALNLIHLAESLKNEKLLHTSARYFYLNLPGSCLRKLPLDFLTSGHTHTRQAFRFANPLLPDLNKKWTDISPSHEESECPHDLTIMVEGHEFKLHKAILEARSNYFRIFFGSHSDAFIELTEVTKANQEIIFDYIISDKLPNFSSVKHCEEILWLAHYHELGILEEHCFLKLKSFLLPQATIFQHANEEFIARSIENIQRFLKYASEYSRTYDYEEGLVAATALGYASIGKHLSDEVRQNLLTLLQPVAEKEPAHNELIAQLSS